MKNNKNILVIIPAYNEENSIAQIVNDIHHFIPDTDIVVIDDGSTDSTVQNASNSGAIVLSHLFNMGYGIAVQTGYKFAARYGYEYILQLDADGQHKPEFLIDILNELKNDTAEVVIGSRFLNGNSYKPPLMRKIGMLFFSKVTSFLTHQKITDPTSGFIGFYKRTLQFLISEYFPCDYPDADAIIMFHKNGFRLKEISVEMQKNNQKSMHSGILKPIYYIFKMTISIFVILLKGRQY